MANQHDTYRIEKECSYCGKTILVIPSKIRKQFRFYCDRKCKDLHHSECMKGENNPAYNPNKTVSCSVCGKEYHLKGKLRETTNRFCSKQCQGVWASENYTGENAPRWMGGLPNCKSCGKPISARKYEYCNSCNQLAERNWSWKGGRGYLYNNLRGLKQYKEWRTSCFIRDEYTCQECGNNCCELNVHHIKTVAQIIEDNNLNSTLDAINCEELWDEDNGITLCIDCHNKIHRGEL